MLRLDDVRLSQGAFRLRVDLAVDSGQRLAVMGVSGSGKSTLLSAIAGFTAVEAGRIEIADRDVTTAPVAERPVSILFQDGNLFPHLSAFDNVALGVAPGLRVSQEQKRAVSESLEKVGLGAYGARKPAALSGGQQSRVALARMLVQGKPLALFDEPFASLDPGLRREMLALVTDLCAGTGMTVVMVTHDLRDARALCDRIVLLDDGAVALDVPVSETLERMPPALAPWD